MAATFRHVASRNNDPQLHTHAVIANMTRNAAGEWRSVEPTQLRRNRRLIGAWYRKRSGAAAGGDGLRSGSDAGGRAAELRACGVFAGDAGGVLDAPPRATFWTTSRTRAGSTARRPRRRRTLHTRKRKDEPAPGELSAMWKARAEALGARAGCGRGTSGPDGARLRAPAGAVHGAGSGLAGDRPP